MSKHQEILEYLEKLAIGKRVSVRSISNHLTVSDGTAYRAIKEAENRGIVETKPRSGTVRVERKSRVRIDKLTYTEIARISDSEVVAGKTGLGHEFSKFSIGAMTEKNIMKYLVKGGLLIVGDREEIQLLALENHNAILVTGGFPISAKVIKTADHLGIPVMVTSELSIIGCEEHLRWQKEAAKRSLTLLKDTQGNLPISPQTHKRIRLYYLEGEKGGIHAADDTVLESIKTALERRGYEVEINDGTTRVKGATLKYRESVDLALTVANVVGYGAQNNYRIQWKTAMSNEVPWYVHEVPTVFVSLNYTTHLHDATMVKTAINAYHYNANTIETLLDALEGKENFNGQPNDLVWANKWQAKL